MNSNNTGSTVYWQKLAKELTEIEKSKVTNQRKVHMLEDLCKKYKLKLV